MDKIIKVKIIEKLNGMVYIRKLEKLDTRITIPEFRYMIGVFKIGKREWFQVAKQLEREGIIKLNRNRSIEVLM